MSANTAILLIFFLLTFLLGVSTHPTGEGGSLISLTRKSHVRRNALELLRASFGWEENRKLPIQWKLGFGSARQNNTHYSPRIRTTVANVPLLGGSLNIGEVYMDITIGTPPGIFTAQVDTGSADFGIPATGCTSCGQVPNFYNPAISTTASSVPCSGTSFTCPTCTSSVCSYSISYQDGSGYRATLHLDKAVVAGLSIAQQSVGAIYRESGGNFEPADVDGIIGLAYPAISETHSPTIMDSLVSSGQVIDVFSMCLTGQGGVMALGGTLPYYTGSLSFVPLLAPYDFYTIYLQDLSVWGHTFNLPTSTYNQYGTIVDSGTTDLLLPRSAYNLFKSKLVANCSQTYLVGVCGLKKGLFEGYCFALTPAQIAAYPPLVFLLSSGVTISIPPQQYLVDGYCSSPGYYALAIDPMDENAVILGDVINRQYTIIYDRVSHRIGFGLAANCPHP